MHARSARSGRREKASLREAMKAWLFGVVVPVLAGIVLYGTAFTLLPRTADGVSVTVVQCATVQWMPVDECPGTTIFHRAFTDTATVSGVRTTLDQLHYEVNSIFDHPQSNYWEQTRVYRIDLLWHGRAVKSYVAPYPPIWWDVTTLGLVAQWAPDGPTTWQDLVRLTGMPLAPNGVP
jgi:hypothetical protein